MDGAIRFKNTFKKKAYLSKGNANAPSPPQRYQAWRMMCSIMRAPNIRLHIIISTGTSLTTGSPSANGSAGDKVVDSMGLIVALAAANWPSHTDRASSTI
jgi:hypothetical protein